AGGIGGLLARTDGNGSAFYHADGVGNVTAVMGANGDLVARYLYNPFGKTVAQWGPLADLNHYRFSSKEILPLAGLYHYGFRLFDPGLQRWLSRDPLGEYGSLNLYRFGRNNPESNVDPEGDSDNNVVSTVTAPSGVNFTSFPNLQVPVLDPSQAPPAALPLQPPPPQIQVPELGEQGLNPLMYNGLLVGGEHLIGTPMGEELAADNALAILTAPGGAMASTKLTAILNKLKCMKGIRFEGLTPDQIGNVRRALREAGMSDANLLIKGADMPPGYAGMTLGDEGFVLNRSIMDDYDEVLKTPPTRIPAHS
ncbi:MAG TPA: RHS repeat-associated core domain-containing protein, partial [Terriglobales bacterium]